MNKNKFIDQFEQIKDIDLMELFEMVLKNEIKQKDGIPNSFNGNSISKNEFSFGNKRISISIKRRRFKKKEQLLDALEETV